MKIIKIENNFNMVNAAENTFYQIKENRYFKVNRINNDVNGNPRYTLEIFESGTNITDEYAAAATLGKYFTKSNKMIFQSYNLSNTLSNYFNNLYEFTLVNYFDVWHTADGWDVNNLCKEFNFISSGDDGNILQVLKKKEFLNKNTRVNQFDTWDDGGAVIEFYYKKENNKPVFRVELIGA